ncbi:MAG TPA: AEC family transporter [Novosphingobium sp.]|nr:AEC family transporter [Novosphingobium sp.]
MLSVLATVLPIFALIFAGWALRRGAVFGPEASGALNRFVVYLALPALILRIVVNARWADIWQPAFVAAFGLGAGAIFALTLALRLRRPRHLADAAIDGLNAAYANTGFMGFPLVLAMLGPAALPPTLAATILTVCVLFALALVLIESGLQGEQHPAHMALKVAGALVRNPLLVAPVLGALCLAAGLHPPAPVETVLDMLGGAASPAALVALGLFLGERRASQRGETAATALLVALKLLAQPLLTWLLAVRVFALPAPQMHAAVLLAALPTGTGPFMLAEFYRREAGLTARVVLLSTLLSLATVTGLCVLWQA